MREHTETKILLQLNPNHFIYKLCNSLRNQFTNSSVNDFSLTFRSLAMANFWTSIYQVGKYFNKISEPKVFSKTQGLKIILEIGIRIRKTSYFS